MKHYGLVIAEGTEITNITVPSGISFPTNDNVGELFYRTDLDDIYVRNNSTWDVIVTGSVLLNVVEDTSPQLGADLDINGFSVLGSPAATPTSGFAGAASIKGGIGGATSGNGGTVLVSGGSAPGSGNGGIVSVVSGTPTNGSGGAINLFVADSVGTDKSGGSATIEAGDGTGTGLGGNLTFRAGSSITGSAGDIFLESGNSSSGSISGSVFIRNVTGSTTSPVVNFSEARVNGTNAVGLRAPNSITLGRNWVLPIDDPATASGQFLTTDTSGNLSFAIPSDGIANIVEDLTPQLGGNLDTNGSNITVATSDIITITDLPSNNTDGVNKQYVDSAVGIRSRMYFFSGF